VTTDILFLSALMWARSMDLENVVLHVLPADFEQPSAADIYEAITRLVNAGNPHGPEAVLAELTRTGQASDAARKTLLDATTAGSSGLETEVRFHASSIVGAAFRRRVETWGKALVDASSNLPEVDLMPLSVREGLAAREHSQRLAALRGEEVAA
jgi:replicative DNA helicase